MLSGHDKRELVNQCTLAATGATTTDEENLKDEINLLLQASC